MDFQRYFLIGALGVFSYLMVLQWDNDYGTASAPVEPVTSTSNSDFPEASTDFLLTPPSGNSPADVPTGINASGQVEAASFNATAGLIKVTTDTLEATIDLRGGDIIQVDLLKHLAKMNQPDVPFTLLEQNQYRTYIAQSGLVGPNGTDTISRPTFKSAQRQYNLDADQDTINVVMTFIDVNGVKIDKVYRFHRDSYLIDLEYNIDNQSSQPWSANLFGQLKRDQSADPTSSNSLGMSAYLGPAFSLDDDKYKRYDFDDIDDQNLNISAQGGWVAMLQHYFVSAWIPNADTQNKYSTRNSNGNYIAGFVSPLLQVQPRQQGSVSAELYIGPKLQDDLEAISPDLDLVVDYGWLWWISQPLFWLLNVMHGIVGNWGFAIILVTLCVKIFFFYPSAVSYRSMAKMRALAPEITKLKERYGDDRQQMSKSMMELYKREKANPLSGCFPILIQMPVFIGLYWMLMESVELRHAPFILWIKDLSVPDPYFILPLLMGLTMFIQQRLNPAPPDPIQARIMKLLPIVFTFFFLWFPAGLVVYWVANNVLSILQQYVITRRIEKEMMARKH